MTKPNSLARLAAAYDSGGLVGMRNRIINGAMMIDQRNAGASVTPTTATQFYTMDRFAAQQSASAFSVQQNAGSVTPPSGFTNYLGVTVTSAQSLSAGSYFTINQYIEGYNIADLGFGTASAQPVTISFWVRSSLTGSFSLAINNAASTRAYPTLYTINAANTWEYKTVTISGDTTGTWLTNNSSGIRLWFGLGFGSNFTGTAGSWNGTSNVLGATGATSVVGTNGATFYITGVQLEKGSTATSFDYRPYGTELQLCQRYYYKVPNTQNSWPVTYTDNSTVALSAPISLPVSMRTVPSANGAIALSNRKVANFQGSVFGTCNLITASSVGQSTDQFAIVASGTSFGGAGAGSVIYWSDTTNYLTLSAEL